MADKVKLAFIGSGGIVRAHLEQGLKDFEDVQFVGWCDLNEETAAATASSDQFRAEISFGARQRSAERERIVAALRKRGSATSSGSNFAKAIESGKL